MNWETSTDYLRAPEDTRRSRDRVVEYAGSFPRMLASANSGYWHGRIVHVYLGLAKWHFRHRRFAQCLNRTVFGLAAFFRAGRYLFDHAFWQAIRADHVPGTLHFIMQNLEKEVANKEGSEVTTHSGSA